MTSNSTNSRFNKPVKGRSFYIKGLILMVVVLWAASTLLTGFGIINLSANTKTNLSANTETEDKLAPIETPEQNLQKGAQSPTHYQIHHEKNNDRHFDPSPYSLSEATINKVYVDKSSQKMYLLQDDKAVKSYHIALGDAPKGHKQQEGDERTPEGLYTLDWKNENSIAYRSIHISYPNETDIANAKARGVSPGGAIMIHGQMNGYEQFTTLNQQRNWTDGCIAVTNQEMDEIMSAVKVGTPIEIVW